MSLFSSHSGCKRTDRMTRNWWQCFYFIVCFLRWQRVPGAQLDEWTLVLEGFLLVSHMVEESDKKTYTIEYGEMLGEVTPNRGDMCMCGVDQDKSWTLDPCSEDIDWFCYAVEEFYSITFPKMQKCFRYSCPQTSQTFRCLRSKNELKLLLLKVPSTGVKVVPSQVRWELNQEPAVWWCTCRRMRGMTMERWLFIIQ